MKTILSVIALAVFLFLPPRAQADEIADLKAQVNAMQATIDAMKNKIEILESQQKAQVESVKKIPELSESVEKLKSKPKPESIFSGVGVGGHLKLYMFDRTEGERNKVEQHTGVSAGLSDLWLYFTKEINDWLSIDVSPELQVTASATPSLGSDLSRSTSSSYSWSIHHAFVTMRLPRQYELKVGTFLPMFSEEYAKETWWEELYHQNLGLALLESWYDSGAELYKNFNFKNWSLPVYLYYLNGNTDRNVDNNEGKTVLLHAAPEFCQSKVRLLGSLGIGRWDDENNYNALRSATGFDWNYKKWGVRGEYYYSLWQNRPLTPTTLSGDATRSGGYVQGSYRFTPKWRGLIKYSLSKLYNTSAASVRYDVYDIWTFGANYFIADGSTIIGQVSTGSGNRSDDTENLKFTRFTLGWRTTF